MKESTARRSPIPCRAVTGPGAAAQQLEAKVGAGTMKIVDENRAIREIPNLDRLKKGLLK